VRFVRNLAMPFEASLARRAGKTVSGTV